MANRFPLVIDTTDGNKLKELPADDNLDLRLNSIVRVQDVTALGTIDAANITVNGNKLVAQTFINLTDTPTDYIDAANKFVKVNAEGTAIEFRPFSDIGNIEVDSIEVASTILPETTGTVNIGSDPLYFNRVTANEFKGDLIASNESRVFNAATGKISYAALEGAPTQISSFNNDIGYLLTEDLDSSIAGLFDDGVAFATDITGSVFGDDSTMLIDGVGSQIVGVINTSQGTITTLTSTQINTSSVATQSVTGNTSNLNITGGGATYNVVIGDEAQTATKNVVIYNGIANNMSFEDGLGVAEYSASADLIFRAGNRIRFADTPVRFSQLTDTEAGYIVGQNGDVIYNTTQNRLQIYQNSAWVDLHKGTFDGNVTTAAGTSNFNDIVIAGDLTVQGTTTSIETTNTDITDNVITLNKGESGAGVTLTTSGIEVDRGTSPNRSLVWTENFGGKWIVTDDATLLANRLEANYLVGSLSVTTDDLIMTDGNVTASGTLTMGGNGLVQIVSVTTDIELLPVGKVKVDGNLEVTGNTTFTGGVEAAAFKGTFVGDDSAVLIDGNNNKIVGDIDTSSLRTSERAVILGSGAGQSSGSYSVAIGYDAGRTGQGSMAVAIGNSAGYSNQGQAIAIGQNAGQTDQSVEAIGIGWQAGKTSQGAQAIAIGAGAGQENQAANSIVINATGSTVQNTQASSLVIKPVRDAVGTTVMMYDATSGEITHTATPGTLAANIDQATVAIGATTATAINIGNAGSTTTINGTVSLPAVVAGSITADDSMSITTAAGDGNAISIGPGGTNRVINLTADDIRFFGPITTSTTFSGGIIGDIKGSVVADDSTVIIDGVSGTVFKANIEDSANWDSAFSWGNHASAGYLTSIPSSITGDVKGSVFADDSSVMVNAVDFTMATDIMNLTPLNAEPGSPISGMLVAADGTSWDPASKSGAVSYPVFYDGAAWNALY